MTGEAADTWWRDAVVYCLDVDLYQDGDGDGCGDLRGLVERLDHLVELGVDCLWLLPFFESPHRDNGYDITDYYRVHPRLGDLGDVVTLLRAAHRRGLRVIIDLVVNHTSRDHPWFRSARSDRSSPYRDFYVWRDEHPEEPHAETMFPDAEDTVWSYDDEAGQWYLHHFYSEQPDLNITNPAVQAEVERIAGFWLELGVDGFRLDAVPYLLETGGLEGAEDLDPHDLIRDLRRFVSRRRGDAVLLGEVNLPADELRRYFGAEHGDELHMAFGFPVNQKLFLALARADPAPLAEELASLPELPPDCQWAHFVRNHDELTLDQLSEDERREVFDAFGPEPAMQLFDRGLRRRLPPMLDADPAWVRMVYSLLLSLPGTPVLLYGEEIGMGEHLGLEGRDAVRTPMQWTAGPTGGFSAADPQDLRRPPVPGPLGPDGTNVAEQRADEGSLLRWMERALRARRAHPHFGRGTCAVVDSGDPAVLAHRLDLTTSVLAVHNFAAEARTGRIKPGLDRAVEAAEPVLRGSPPCRVDDGVLRVELPPRAHGWYRLA